MTDRGSDVATDEGAGWEAQIRADPSVVRIVQALALAEGFHFHILVCETARVTDAVIAAANVEVPALRGTPGTIVRVNPYEKPTAGGSGRSAGELKPLLSRSLLTRYDAHADDRLIFVDVTRAPSEDD